LHYQWAINHLRFLATVFLICGKNPKTLYANKGPEFKLKINVCVNLHESVFKLKVSSLQNFNETLQL
jgi:hypothetical protein